MNTKRLASVLVILGLMATNMAQAFADTVITTGTSTTTTVKGDRAAEKAKRTTDRATEKAAKQADKAAKSAVDLACMQTAIATRETSVVSSFDTYFTDLKIALSARVDALKAAWALTDATARKAAIKQAWSDFNTASKTDRNTLKSGRRAAWDKFKTDAQACHASSSETNDTANDTSI